MVTQLIFLSNTSIMTSNFRNDSSVTSPLHVSAVWWPWPSKQPSPVPSAGCVLQVLKLCPAHLSHSPHSVNKTNTIIKCMKETAHNAPNAGCVLQVLTCPAHCSHSPHSVHKTNIIIKCMKETAHKTHGHISSKHTLNEAVCWVLSVPTTC